MSPRGKSTVVSLGERSYRVFVKPGGLQSLGGAVRKVARGSRCFLLTNRRVQRLWGGPVVDSLTAAGFEVVTATVPEGEGAKSLAQVGRLYEALLRHQFDRQSLVVTLGGGVVGDLGGFVAATYQRGVDFVQVPTTLLAQVDASVGGKTAINHCGAKNMVGAFHQPRLVYIDPTTLASLSRRQLRCGLAEVIKHGVILDAALFRYCERETAALLAADARPLTHVINRSCQLKAHVVTEDERESGPRAILNYGHTLGHAIESAGAGKWFHGEAVSLGMVGAAYLAQELGRVDQSFVDRQRRLLARTGLPVATPGLDAQDLWNRMQHDKKAAAGSLRWVLPARLGEVEVVAGVPRDCVLAALDRLGD